MPQPKRTATDDRVMQFSSVPDMQKGPDFSGPLALIAV
jgi:hypothetical protein